MTTIKDIVDTYLKAWGLVRIKGAENDASPLLPLIMMDSGLSLYRKYIEPVECRHELKKLKNQYKEHYNRFNRSFFGCLNDEQTDFVIEMMDAFDEFIAHDIMVAFVQFTNLFKSEEFEKQKILAASMMANVLCQCAEIVWERVFRAAPNKINQDIKSCARAMHKWSDGFYGANMPDVDPNKSKPICDAIDILCDKQVKFLYKYHKNEDRNH